VVLARKERQYYGDIETIKMEVHGVIATKKQKLIQGTALKSVNHCRQQRV